MIQFVHGDKGGSDVSYTIDNRDGVMTLRLIEKRSVMLSMMRL